MSLPQSTSQIVASGPNPRTESSAAACALPKLDRCLLPPRDEFSTLLTRSKEEATSFQSESVNTTNGTRTFRVVGHSTGQAELQELSAGANGIQEWRKHSEKTIRPFYFSEGKLFGADGKQIGDLFLSPNHINAEEKLLKGSGVIRIEGKDFQFDGKSLSLVTDSKGKSEWGVVIVGRPPSTDLTISEINKRLDATLPGIADYSVKALDPEVKRLISEMGRDLALSRVDPKKVELLQAFACMATETFDPANIDHQKLVRDTIVSLRELGRKIENHSANAITINARSETLTKLGAVEAMFHVLCVDKEAVIGEMVATQKLSPSSPIAVFREKIIAFKSLTNEEQKSLGDQSIKSLKSESDPNNRAEAYLNLAALYYTQKSEADYKAHLKTGLAEFAKAGSGNSQEALCAAIFLAHTSWDKLTPEALHTIVSSPVRDTVLPFAAILTNVVPEGATNGVTSQAGWKAYIDLYGRPDLQHPASAKESEITNAVFQSRMKLLGVD